MKTIAFNVKGKERRHLADEIGNALAEIPCYLRVPTYAYQIGNCILDKDAVLHIPSEFSDKDITDMLSHLMGCGFIGEVYGDTDRIAVTVPIIGFTNASLANLDKLIRNREELFKRAFCVDSINITVSSDSIEFAWFPYTEDGDEIKSYTAFVEKLCDMAKSLKRVSDKAVQTDNDKYAFRCFLLRLGFIGEEYKTARKILLKNLTGNSAFR